MSKKKRDLPADLQELKMANQERPHSNALEEYSIYNNNQEGSGSDI
jgi:hypothetical protein